MSFVGMMGVAIDKVIDVLALVIYGSTAARGTVRVIWFPAVRFVFWRGPVAFSAHRGVPVGCWTGIARESYRAAR